MTKGEQRRLQILEVAKKLFLAKGYTKTTTSEIAHEAGISEGTIFRYFKDKQSLFLEIIRPVVQNTFSTNKTNKGELSSKEGLKAFLIDRITTIRRENELIRLFLLESYLLREWDEVDFMDETKTFLINCLHELGVDRDKQFVSRILLGLIFSYLIFPDTSQQELEKIVAHVVDTLSDVNKEKENAEK